MGRYRREDGRMMMLASLVAALVLGWLLAGRMGA